MQFEKEISREAAIQAAFCIALEFIGPNGIDIAWCDGCMDSVPMVTPEAAAILEKTTLKEILNKLADERLHYRTSMLGASSICLGSLIAGSEQPSGDEIETLIAIDRKFVRANPATA